MKPFAHRKRMFGIVVSLALLGVALLLLDWDTLKRVVLRVNPWGLSLVVCVSFLQFVVMSVRWHHLIQKKVPLPLAEHMKHYFYSILLNTFTPANLGGDVYRVVALDAHLSNRSSVLVALVQERLLGLMVFFLSYLVCWGGSWSIRPDLFRDTSKLFTTAGSFIFLGVIGLVCLPLGFDRLALQISRRFPGWLSTALQDLHAALWFDSLASFVKLMGLSFLAMGLWILTVHMVAVDLGLHVSWLTLGMIVVLVELVRLLPVSIQGIGVREGAYAYLFSVIGESSEAGFVLGTVSYLALSLSVLMAGVVGFGCLIVEKQYRSL
jgi:glycosyltransferase 2 family protein